MAQETATHCNLSGVQIKTQGDFAGLRLGNVALGGPFHPESGVLEARISGPNAGECRVYRINATTQAEVTDTRARKRPGKNHRRRIPAFDTSFSAYPCDLPERNIRT